MKKTIIIEGQTMRYKNTLEVLGKISEYCLVFRIESMRDMGAIYGYYIEYMFEFSKENEKEINELLERIDK